MGLRALWVVWDVEFLIISSLVLQVLLLIFTEWRRRVSWALLCAVLNGILWLLYQMADEVAIYVLGHLSLSSRPHEQQQLMAFWASLLLVHLGGQDTITAYAMEDNNLWLRHLFTVVVQAAGAAYVLYKYVGGSSTSLLAAALLMFLVGVAKCLERIYVLYSSGLDNICKFLEDFEVPAPKRRRNYPLPDNLDDEEEVLQGAHDLLHVCMGQFVDYKVWPSRFQIGAISAYCGRTNPEGTTGRNMLPQLVGMQLSLMRDILYTKAAVIHTWYGCMLRVFSSVSVIIVFHLFQLSTMPGGGGGGYTYTRGDMVVTYVLLAGAIFLEVTSLLRAAASTWTCAWLRDAGWNQLHAALVYLRRGVKAAQRCRKWSGFIGQHDLSGFLRHRKMGAIYVMASRVGLEHQLSKLHFLDPVVMSDDVEDLLLQEVVRMVEACGGYEHIVWSYRGQLALSAWGDGFYDGVGIDKIGFDGSILAWHYATHAFLDYVDVGSSMNQNHPVQGGDEEVERQRRLANVIRTLSRYMMFLLLERPHLLPSTVRRSQYDSFCAGYREFQRIDQKQRDIPQVIRPAVHLTDKLLDMCDKEGVPVEEALQVISGVWVEMLCYAASHCSDDSHARQLSRGSEFITIAWILTTAVYNHVHYYNPRIFVQACTYVARHNKRRRWFWKPL